LRNHPELTDADLVRLIGTTKATISKIRDRGHWNSPNIKAVDPVTLGLCSQIELDFVVLRASQRKPSTRGVKKAESLKPVEETTAETPPAAEAPSEFTGSELTDVQPASEEVAHDQEAEHEDYEKQGES
jgi:hypothetical protein